MIPGMGGRGMNPRDMRRMMKQFGIDLKEIPDVEEVVVRTKSKDYVIRPAEVSIMTAQGQKTWQIVGEATERVRTSTPAGAAATPAAASAPAGGAPPAPLFSDADVELVVQNTGATPEKARRALEASKGEVADAIVRLLEGGA